MGNLARFALSIGAVALFAGCNSGASSLDPAGAIVPSNDRTNARAHIHPHRLWAAADIARTRRLLFISDFGTNTVDIYSMPDLTIKGQVGGFNNEEGLGGECADRRGNIWVTSGYFAYEQGYGTGTLTKLARDGTVLRSVDVESGGPWSCAVDPATGNLAVTINGYSQGFVVIYPDARGSGQRIANPQQGTYMWDSYDASGHLWVDGWESYAETFILSRCTALSCSTIPISGGAIYYPGFLQYAAGEKMLYVADQYCGNTKAFCIYPVSGSGVLGTPITLTDRHGSQITMDQQAVITNGKSRVVAGGAVSGETDTVARWHFPAGGSWTNGTFSEYVTGAAISEK